MRYLTQKRTLLAATCWRRDYCCLMEYRTLEDPENVSEAQVDKKIIPAITDLDVPLVIQPTEEADQSNTRGREGLMGES